MTLNGSVPARNDSLLQWIQNSNDGFPCWRDRYTRMLYPGYPLVDLICDKEQSAPSDIYLAEIYDDSSAELLRGLSLYHLIDEMVIFLLPVISSETVPVSKHISTDKWELVRTKTFKNGICRLTYQDPIGILSDELNYYSYVDDTNNNIDVIGLKGTYVFVIDKKKKIAYVGKGKWARFRKSVRHRTEEVNGKRTNPTSWASKYYGNDEFAEMVESKVISEMIRDKYILVNKIASPGLKRYKQANDVTKKLVDKAAEDLIAEMKSNQGKDIKKEPHHH